MIFSQSKPRKVSFLNINKLHFQILWFLLSPKLCCADRRNITRTSAKLLHFHLKFFPRNSLYSSLCKPCVTFTSFPCLRLSVLQGSEAEAWYDPAAQPGLTGRGKLLSCDRELWGQL